MERSLLLENQASVAASCAPVLKMDAATVWQVLSQSRVSAVLAASQLILRKGLEIPSSAGLAS